VADHPDYASNALRDAHREPLGEVIAARFAELTAAAATELLAAVPVAFARVNTMAEVWAHPQLAARGRWHQIDTPAGPVPALALPGLVDPSPRMDPVPALGEHTRPILAELGLTALEIDALVAEGIAADAP
jgi:crotonobetainyl-CoA:carnitine CoA-transferase CaiB-like acyl-CoA transferase